MHDANLNFEVESAQGRDYRGEPALCGSLTLDEDLMEAANLLENEKVQVVNVNNGERLDTYLIKGKRGSGVCCLNGPAARRGMTGDIVVIIAYCTVSFEEAKSFKPWIIFPKEGNKL